jgi:hypothetical protein
MGDALDLIGFVVVSSFLMKMAPGHSSMTTLSVFRSCRAQEAPPCLKASGATKPSSLSLKTKGAISHVVKQAVLSSAQMTSSACLMVNCEWYWTR